jgi:hypothetical protein
MQDESSWQELYQAAFIETDHRKLPNRISLAKAAIDARLHDMQLGHGGTTEERQAISDALAGLSILRIELEQRSSDPHKYD